MRFALLLLALLIPLETRALERWTSLDTALELTFVGVTVADVLQTHTIADHPRMLEMNPILGPKPSAARINTYFVATIVGHAAIARLLPQPYRRIWQCTWIGIEAHAVYRNSRVGVGFSFRW